MYEDIERDVVRLETDEDPDKRTFSLFSRSERGHIYAAAEAFKTHLDQGDFFDVLGVEGRMMEPVKQGIDAFVSFLVIP